MNADPSCQDLRRAMYALDPALLGLHSHTKQAVGDDLLDAVATSPTNREAGLKVRAPDRLKAYRPLSFTRNFGWLGTSQGRLGLSLGRGRARIVLPLPTLLDPATGLDVSPAAYSSKTCPACLSRNRPTGRNHQCRACGFAAHRDAVGAVNIAMRAVHGQYRRIDPGAKIRVTYLPAPEPVRLLDPGPGLGGDPR